MGLLSTSIILQRRFSYIFVHSAPESLSQYIDCKFGFHWYTSGFELSRRRCFYRISFHTVYPTEKMRGHNGRSILIYHRPRVFLPPWRRWVVQVSSLPHCLRYIDNMCTHFHTVCRYISAGRYTYINQLIFCHSHWQFCRYYYAVILLVVPGRIQLNYKNHRGLRNPRVHSCVRWCRHKQILDHSSIYYILLRRGYQNHLHLHMDCPPGECIQCQCWYHMEVIDACLAVAARQDGQIPNLIAHVYAVRQIQKRVCHQNLFWRIHVLLSAENVNSGTQVNVVEKVYLS